MFHLKTKITSNTYLRDITKYRLKIYFNEDDCYIIVKKIIDCTEKFLIRDNLTVIDNDYYVLKVVPKKESYAMRVF